MNNNNFAEKKGENHLKYNEKIHNKICDKYNSQHKEIYNAVEQNRLKIVINFIINLTKIQKPKVLDVGSGTGNLTNYFINNNCDVTSSDVSNKSLDFLKRRFNYNKNLSTKLITSENLPFEDNTFDITATYSVLHHVPDYLNTVSEMIRVTKIGGYIFIDHEANENKWNNSILLNEYYKLSTENLGKKLKRLFIDFEAFSFQKWYSFFIVKFINPRFQIEGDIHVRNDDHIERDKIKNIISNNCSIIKEEDYLLYNTNITLDTYNLYKDKTSDIKYLIFQKK